MPILVAGGASMDGDEIGGNAETAGTASAIYTLANVGKFGAEIDLPLNSPDMACFRQVYSWPLETSCSSVTVRTQPPGPNASRCIASFCSIAQYRHPDTREITSIRLLI